MARQAVPHGAHPRAPGLDRGAGRPSRWDVLTAARVLLILLCAALLAVAGCNNDDGSEGEAPAETKRDAGASSGGFEVIPEVVRGVAPSVVAIEVRTAQGAGEGSGVIWSADGEIVTNNHVAAGAEEASVLLASGERLKAEVVATDPLTDLAVLRVDRDGLPAAQFAKGLPDPGALAIAIGNPLGFEETVTAGVISGLDRALPTGGQTPELVGLLQTDAPISPGNSGGALVDSDGRVTGINVAYIPPEQRAVSIGFAIPSPVVREVVAQLLDDGKAEHAYLGTSVRPVGADPGGDSEGGVVVAAVEKGSPADDAGLRRGDVIVEAGGRPVATVEDLYSALRQRDPGEELEVAFVRDGERDEATVTLADRP
jgi:serine protease DegQ